MAKRLLDRQVRLLEYLTSGAAIFDGGGSPSLDPSLRGIDHRLLRLEARFSYDKRMEKIVAVFPRTLRILDSDRDRVVRDFVTACPPTDLSRLVNARQFYDFLSTRWRAVPPEPRYLCDVAACEFARVRVRVDTWEDQSESRKDERSPPSGSIRRRTGVILLRCAYDVRPVFEHDEDHPTPAKRRTLIAVAMPPGAADPCVLELFPAVFDLLSALDEWTDPTALGAAPQLDDLIHDLLQHGLIELRG